jgi:hypothetical protein
MKNRLFISLGMHSAAIIAFQLALMQLITAVQWHHFAYMIISVAMLGFGAGGTVLALGRKRLLAAADWLVPLLMTISGLLMMISFEVSRISWFRFDAYLLFTGFSQFPILAANYFIYFLPFFFGALAIGIIFTRHADQIGAWYFANLLGSGLGGIFILLIIGSFLPQQLPPITGIFSVIAGLISISRIHRKWQLVLGFFAIAAATYMFIKPGELSLSEYKDLARIKNLPEATIIHREPGLHGLIEVVESPALRYAPAVSLTYIDPLPVKKMVFVNGDTYGMIPRYDSGRQFHIHNYTTQALPYITQKPEKVLLLQASTGSAISQALANNASTIDAVIPNTDIVKLMKTRFADASGGLFLHDGLRVFSREVRNFIASAPHNTYDLIIIPMQESFGGSAGINALHEDYSLTKEALTDMWKLLVSDGAISVSTWLDYPSRASLKLLASLVLTATTNGADDPGKHIAAIRSWGTITFILKKTPITDAEITSIRKFCDINCFDPLLLPGLLQHERQQYNMLGDTSLFTYMDQIMAGNYAFMADYGFMIQPATDDKPYFSQYLKLGNLRQLANTYSQGQLPFLELGYLIVVVTLIQSAILALLFILLPLFRLRKNNSKGSGTLIYFASLGIGYMFVEIILIQRFVLYFGQPIYALSAVISTMLIASGIGSLVSGRVKAYPRHIAGIALVVTACLLILAFGLTPFMQLSMASPLYLKILWGLLIIGIPAFFKGMLFPLGIRHLSSYDHHQIPWAWGINGSISVISTSLATLIAVEAGFRVVMIVAVGCYFIASLIFLFHTKFYTRTSHGDTHYEHS